MLANVTFETRKYVECNQCKTEVQVTENYKNCPNCGYLMNEIQFDREKEFNNNKLAGQKHELDEQYKDNSIAAECNIGEMIQALKLKSDYPGYLDSIGQTPLRIIKFAYKGMFLDHGTNIQHYSAAALYIALRFYKAPFLLMDFSDKLNVNLFKLAKCYRKLAKYLNVTLKLNEKLPAIDPSLYIPRFCKELNFGEKTEDVKNTAIKLLKRMKLDWIAHGRRPSSLCGAAILIAGKMHDFNITTRDVCQIVFVCEETIRKRLDEFKETEVAQLTREKFDEIDIEKMQIERDPPAFLQNQKNQEKKKQQQQKQFIAIQNQQIPEEKLQDVQKNLNNCVEDLQEAYKETGGQKNNDEQSKKELETLELVAQSSKVEVDNQQNYQLVTTHKDIAILQDKGEINEDESLSSLSEEDEFILTKEEQTLKSIVWYDMNKQWLEEQQRKIPEKIDQSKKYIKKRRNKKYGQIMSGDGDPIKQLIIDKTSKKFRNNLNEVVVRDLLEKKIDSVKNIELDQVFVGNNNNNPNSIQYIQQAKINQDILKTFDFTEDIHLQPKQEASHLNDMMNKNVKQKMEYQFTQNWDELD